MSSKTVFPTEGLSSLLPYSRSGKNRMEGKGREEDGEGDRTDVQGLAFLTHGMSDMHIIVPHPRPAESEYLGGRGAS